MHGRNTFVFINSYYRISILHVHNVYKTRIKVKEGRRTMILTVSALKGGTGKTTTALALSQAAAADGRRVLLIDLDGQCNLSFSAGADSNHKTSMDLLHGDRANLDMIQRINDNIFIIGASPNLLTEISGTGSALRLKTALQPIKRYFDLIVIDTPSFFGELVFNAMQASEYILIPLHADSYSLQGLSNTLNIIQQIKETNKRLKLLGAILTEFNQRTTFGRFIFDQLQQLQSVKLLGTVRKSIAIQEAQNLRRSIFTYKPRCAAAADYLNIYKTLPIKTRLGNEPLPSFLERKM